MNVRQYLTSVASSNRPAQQSSPSDNSMSTATPPQQISRASPASTALVMSSNNLTHGSAHHQSSSRQLTPNTNSNGSSNNGTGASSTGNTGQHGNVAGLVSGTGNGPSANGAPNPLTRQFVCHAKSMSAGVVVPVPGISNNLASAAGMHQNNVINNNIASNHRSPHPIDVGMPAANAHHQISGHHQPQIVSRGLHHRSHHGHQQQVIQGGRSSHHGPHHGQHNGHQTTHLVPSTQPPLPPHQTQPYELNQHQHHHHNHHHGTSGSSQFVNARQATSSSIVLNNNQMNTIHNRSASTHLSNVFLGSQNPHSSSHHLAGSRSNYFPQVTNSIWSIDENLSKSHGKLTASSYIPHPYLFNPSITDVSCDNVSNVSRMVDGPPAPGYYLHAPPRNLPPTMASNSNMKMPEFLPICDFLFNFISMMIYFCGNVFAVIALFALYHHAESTHWALVGAAFLISSNVLCQFLSLKWLYKTKLEDCRRKREAQEELEQEEGCERRYYNRMTSNLGSYQCGSCGWLPDSATEVQLKFLLSVALDAIMHLFGLGILVRYIKLVIPISDSARVKKEARDLSMLRMIHGFTQAAPILLLQAYLICSQTSVNSVTTLSLTSAILALVNVCWAHASFTKYARKKFMHKFELTWMGILCQFFWRLGTISSRVVALTIYAVYFNCWMLVVLSLHWTTMFLWFMKPGNLLRDEVNLPKARRITYAMGAAWVYCICYMNFEEHNSKLKMIIYYSIMFLENSLLLTVSLIFSSQHSWFKNVATLVVYLGFVFGMLFMFLYYKYFHVNVLNNGLSCSQESIDSIADQLSPAGKKIAGFKPGTLRLKNEDVVSNGPKYNIGATLRSGSHPEMTRNIKPTYLTSNDAKPPTSGVFNCNLPLEGQKIPTAQPRRQNP